MVVKWQVHFAADLRLKQRVLVLQGDSLCCVMGSVFGEEKKVI